MDIGHIYTIVGDEGSVRSVRRDPESLFHFLCGTTRDGDKSKIVYRPHGRIRTLNFVYPRESLAVAERIDRPIPVNYITEAAVDAIMGRIERAANEGDLKLYEFLLEQAKLFESLTVVS